MRRRCPDPWMGVGTGLALSLMLACGGGGGSPSAPQPVSVALTPSGLSLWTGGTQTFQAAVSGSSNPAVTWSVVENGGGSITTSGLYTAPATAGNFHVQAVSVADVTKSAQAPVTVSVEPPPGACNGADLGIVNDQPQEVNLHGFTPFPSDNAWNLDVSDPLAYPADPNSDAIIAFIGAGTGLHPDFGSGTWKGANIGIPFMVVDSTTAPKVPVAFSLYGDESDPGPMPIPASAPVEGGNSATGDRHVLVLDRATCVLYELDNAHLQSDGSWKADSAAVWDLQSDHLRPFTWTSADAAGLPIFPGLARYDEVAADTLTHALRFTVPVTRKGYVLPATHWASSNTSASAPPMGMRVRLKAGVDISSYSPQAKIVLAALKRYGMILADNGSAWYISGAPDLGWNDDDLHNLGGITGSDFEVLKMGTVVTSAPSGTAPTLSAFTATPASTTTATGAQLSWSSSNATRWFITPEVGWVTGSTVTVHPTATTTYSLEAEGPFGSATASQKVTITGP